MSGERIEPFPDNWAYLRTELAWLDRVLSLAIAKKRSETKAINDMVRSQADRVTSHWWKGLIHLESAVAADSPVAGPRHRPGQGNYQQQLEARIQVSQQAGIVLGIPALCERLQLSKFEKQVILLTLAPEISHRYGQIYGYLQEREDTHSQGLPTVDLLLRLLCRTEVEWRCLRQSFTADSALLHYDLITIQSLMPEPLLGRPVKLSDSLVHFLLADSPSLMALEDWLPGSKSHLVSISASDRLQVWQPVAAPSTDPWEALVLPDPLLAHLKHLVTRLQSRQPMLLAGQLSGTLVLFSGLPGTGKRTAAQTLAEALKMPLCQVDLATQPADTYPALLQQLISDAPQLLLLNSAQKWFGRSAEVAEVVTHRFVKNRQQFSCLTILCVDLTQQCRPYWRRQLETLEFPMPDQQGRLRLWQQILPEDICRRDEINWSKLAQVRLTGGKISAIAQDAAVYAATESVPLIQKSHLLQALTLHLPDRRQRFLNELLR